MNEAYYEEALNCVREMGQQRGDRTGTGTTSLFGLQMDFDMRDGFPLVTTKKVYWKGVVEELLWFLRGETNAQSLQDAGVKIWDEWALKEDKTVFNRMSNHERMVAFAAKRGITQSAACTLLDAANREANTPNLDGSYQLLEAEGIHTHREVVVARKGDLGPIYGKQWRSWACPSGQVIDQIADVIEQIKTNPMSRRLVVSAWNPADVPDMALPPCHMFFQFYVTSDGHLDCQMYQRSADMFLGVPFNIASYALLTTMIAHVTGLKPGRFVHVIGDAHIYSNHIPQVDEQLRRDPRPLPKVYLNPEVTSIDGFTAADITLIGYDPHPAIRGEVSV